MPIGRAEVAEFSVFGVGAGALPVGLAGALASNVRRYDLVGDATRGAEELWAGSPGEATRLFEMVRDAREEAVVGRLTGWAGADTADAASYALFLLFDVPESDQRDFDDFYELEHAGLLLKCPDWLTCRRYEILASKADRCTRLVVHELRDLRALQSEERRRAMTPWRSRIAAHPWFEQRREYCATSATR